MKVKSMLIGLVVGMAAGMILVETCPPVKQFVANGKKKIKKMFQAQD